MSHDSILSKVNESLMIILIVSSPVLIAAVEADLHRRHDGAWRDLRDGAGELVSRG